jgi:hypothetical protein
LLFARAREQVSERMITMGLEHGSLSTAETNELIFDVLSDIGNTVARRFGLVYAFPQGIAGGSPIEQQGPAGHQRR